MGSGSGRGGTVSRLKNPFEFFPSPFFALAQKADPEGARKNAPVPRFSGFYRRVCQKCRTVWCLRREGAIAFSRREILISSSVG